MGTIGGLSPGAHPEGKAPPFSFPLDAPLLEVALAYARYGWPVFPTQPRTKTPYPGTHGFYDATLDLDRIQRWWKRNPYSMVAVATGLFSGIFAVDLDRKETDKDGVATWAQLVAERGAPPTLSSTTPSTGQHHFFRHRNGLRCVKLNTIAPGVEIKADGGYVVLPPSFCTAVTNGAGASYKWNAPLIPVAEPPDWLVDEIRGHNERTPPAENEAPPPVDPSVSHERIKAALSVIDPDIDRRTWIEIGCALVAQLGNAGFELWNGWSSKGNKYKSDEMQYQWDSLVKGRYPYTIGTLFYFANQAQPDWARVVEPNQPGHVDDGGHHERDQWPEMGAAAYHGFAGEVVNTILPHTEADPVALLIQLLVCFGNIVGRARYVQTESNRQHPNLFLGLVGASAKTRKGTSFGRILAVVDVANHQWADERIQGGLSSGEGLIHVIRDPILKWDKEEQQWIEVDHGVDDKRLLIVEPEFASVLAIMERSGNTVSHLLRKGWDGVKLQTMTRKEPLTATDPHISIIGHITEDELRLRLTRTDMANGFANRFLFALIKRSKLLPFGGNLEDSEIQEIGRKLRDIIEAVLGDPLSGKVPPPRLTMTDRAGEKWGHLYHDLAVEHPGLLGAITARAETQMLRLALIYALLDKANQIDLPHIEAGRAVWNYCDASAVHIFGDTLGDEVADTILAALKNAGRDGFTRTAIRDLFGGHKTRGQIDAALGLLLKMGRVRRETQGGVRGRPVEVWFLR